MRKIDLQFDTSNISAASMLGSAALHALLGILLLLRRQMMLSIFHRALSATLALIALLGFVSFLFGKSSDLRQWRQLVTGGAALAGFMLSLNDQRVVALMPLALGFGSAASGLLLLVTCSLKRANNEWVSVGALLSGVAFSACGLALFFSPISTIGMALNLMSAYCLMAAVSRIFDFLDERRPISPEERSKRRLHVNRPGYMLLFEPRRQRRKLLQYQKRRRKGRQDLDEDDDGAHGSENESDGRYDFEILIHATEKGLGSIGHMDICFEDTIRTYGPYDWDSHRFKGILCRGVLVVAKGRDRYIEFCTKYSKKTVFCFGLRLSERQRERVRESIAELMEEAVVWQSPARRDPDGEHQDYASAIQTALDAQLFHFARGTFHTFFMGGINCCALADRIVGSLGTGVLSMNTLLTPGAYFSYLDREYRRPNSIVVSKEAFRADE